jgi:superfamily II DNA or RNA helicase
MLTRMRFSGRWRDYQRRVLDELESALSDRRLHLVAAPGSGKTIVGLEIMRRLGRPAIILAPSRTIRDQWSGRLVPMFLSEPPGPEEVSTDLEAGAAMITATYQALHALWAAEEPERFRDWVRALRDRGPLTLILDEAHHLRREWWSALQALAEALPDARLVALTATPPYDSPGAEWSRYEAMCGPVDLEIGVPELVRNGDLCPHQDHVIFSAPGPDALALADRRRSGVAAIRSTLLADRELLDFLQAHPWLQDASANVEAILESPEMLSAILVHLAAAGRPLPSAPLRLLAVGRREVPLASDFWLEVLLDGLLFRFPGTFPIGDERRRQLRAALDDYGLIEGGAVRLAESRRLFTLMARSLGRLESIADIAAAEAANLGPALRMLILSDYIREGELSRSAAAGYRPAKPGVVPVFERLRRAAVEGQRLAVLTGSLVILPEGAEAPLRALAAGKGLAEDDLQFTPLAECPGYARLAASARAADCTVALATALFEAGHVTILCGTQSLLGEGWDAPSLNSLVLASNSAAFMLSNQMRGRAIRIDPGRPDKVAAIWHLATAEEAPTDLEAPFRERLNWGALDDGEPASSDVDLLRRRFRAFEGVSSSEPPRIESGLDRLGPWPRGRDAANARTFAAAADRRATAEAWRRSLGAAAPHARVRETVAVHSAPRRLAWHDTLRWLGASAAADGALAMANEMRHVQGMGGAGAVAMAVAGAAAVAALPPLAKAAWLACRNGSLEASLEQVGRVVIATLGRTGTLSAAELGSSRFEVRRGLTGGCDVALHGTSRATERTVIDAMAEILGPVGNPRYLLVRKSWLGPLGRTDYHSVPAAFGQRKEWAEHFLAEWKARVGSSRLVFTRTTAGRIDLLRARARSFAAGFQRRAERRSAWL